MNEEAASRGFNKLCLSTLVAVFLLIAAGGIVRTTGSGMGCPDWPKCFGQWVPPTSIDQLPADYKESYSALREKKNQKFIKYLKVVGMTNTANQLSSDKSILIESDFNPTKTWIEYLNRLLGVLVGFLILLLVWRSIRFRANKPTIFLISLATLVAVLFQGWFGSIVVSTNLTTWTVTVHMLVALLIVGLLAYLVVASGRNREEIAVPKGIKPILLTCSALLLTQILFGTQVREGIDKLVSFPRTTWISSLGFEFILHRSFSWLVIGFHFLLIWRLGKTTGLKALSSALMALILFSFLTGAAMAYFNVPAALQPVHLLLATICFGIQLLLYFQLNSSKKEVLIG
ncbi:MAG: COX15/CtaA family protein [Cytophagales bacterium]|jgi:cytochrome c oxidase assembly protein subunit 15|nr:COX15/CtaA family protein [Cytophagales bacterium]MCA6366052.1 COX15/CtaA family protein [Cytophagales bacterium]MCA6373144.1 COX15/CtaA family protein [Cytophagales bacterium]MCA6383472.1 COX15/CtaA family protein [Cytophagales bacterium]